MLKAKPRSEMCIYTEFEAVARLTIERNKLLAERDEARQLAEEWMDRTLSIWNEDGHPARQGEGALPWGERS